MIDSKEYGLDPDYSHNFIVAGEFGVENIFEINHVYRAQFLAARNLGTIRQGSAGMDGYGFANPTQDFVDASYTTIGNRLKSGKVNAKSRLLSVTKQ